MSRASNLLIAGVGALAPLLAAAQPAAELPVELRGRVLEAQSERPLEGARVSAGATQVFTDVEGSFSLRVPRDTRRVSVEAAGHLPETIALGGGALPAELIVLLVERDRFRETVVVAAEPDTPAAPPPLPVRPIEVLSQAGALDNVFRSLQTLAGVAGPDEFGSRLAVRGGGPDQNLTIMDGVEIHNPYRLFGLTSAFNPETVSDFELSTGAFSVRYGDRLSSLLQVQNRLGDAQRSFAGSTSLSLTDANLILEGKLPGARPGSWLLTGRRTYYDLVAERIVDDDLPSFGDVQTRVSRELYPGSRLTLTGLLSRESTDGSFAGDEDERADVLAAARNDLVSLSWETPLGRSGSARSVASWYRFVDSLDFDGRLESDNRVSRSERGEAFGFIDVIFRRDLEVRDLSLRQELFLSPWRRHLLDLGGEIHGLDTRWAWEIPGDRNPTVANGSSVRGGSGLPALLDSPVGSARFGAWLADRFQVTDRLQLEAGLRFDHSTLVGSGALSPRASLLLELDDATRLRAAVGRHTQSPGYEKLYQADYFVDLSGEPELAYEHSTHLVLGLERDLAPGVSARVEGYHKRFEDLVIGRLETEAERLARVARYDFPDELRASIPVEPEITSTPANAGGGRAYGLDVFLAKRPSTPQTRLMGWLSYAWGVAERDAYSRRYPFDYDRRHALSLVASWRASRKLELGVTARWASGFPYTPARGVRAVATEDPERPERLVPERDEAGNLVWGTDPGGVGNLNAARLPAFARFDLRLSFRPRGPSGRWLVYLEVINATNRENAAQLDYDIRFDEEGEPFLAGSSREGGIPLLPSFGVRFRF